MDARGAGSAHEIQQLCLAVTAAIRDRDEATLNRVMADDFTFTSERGRWGKHSSSRTPDGGSS